MERDEQDLRINQVLPGVYHIQDNLGVCMTLLCGSRSAMLVDTGYGISDVSTVIRSITQLPLKVILTHGHHDHCMGVRWFDHVSMFPEDHADFATYTGEYTRRRILTSADDKGQPVADDYLTAQLAMPETLTEQVVDLGGITAQIIHCPGHTPGSCCVYVKEHALMLTGDNWNPCTWLFFPAALGIREYLKNMRKLLELPFSQVLCSHQPVLFSRDVPDAFFTALTEDAIANAHPVTISPYDAIHTVQADLPMNQLIVFDRDKAC